MKERILKTNNDDGEYLKYRKDLKKFYENETLEYLKSEKLRIEVRYEDRKQNDVYSRLSFIVSIIALCMSILNFLISENERDSVLWYIIMILIIILGVSFVLIRYNIHKNEELIQCTIALQVLDELIAEKKKATQSTEQNNTMSLLYQNKI